MGLAMAVVAFILERIVMRSVKKSGDAKGQPPTTTVISKGGEVDLVAAEAQKRLQPGELLSTLRQALAGIAARVGKLEIQTIDGAPISESGLEATLREAGFGTTPKGVVLWPERRPILA